MCGFNTVRSLHSVGFKYKLLHLITQLDLCRPPRMLTLALIKSSGQKYQNKVLSNSSKDLKSVQCAVGQYKVKEH